MHTLHRWVRLIICRQCKVAHQYLQGPRNRAPLGLKTNNAKAKVLQTPAPLPLENEVKKGDPKTGSARKPKPKASPAKMTKIEVLGDMNELEEDIEYMPPPVQGRIYYTNPGERTN